MKVKIFSISSPTLNEEGITAFKNQEDIQWTRNADATNAAETVELAGRICYMSFGELQHHPHEEFITNLIKNGHESVLEHVNWSFILTGVSRGFTHQLVRHRVGFAFSQLSQQYFNESGAQLVEPEFISKYPEIEQIWKRVTASNVEAYSEILNKLINLEDVDKDLPFQERKEIKRAIYSAARSVLPNATETKIFITANARAIRHFLSVRGNTVGDVEMREVSKEIFNLVAKDAPILFLDFYEDKLEDGTPVILKK